MTLLFVTGNSQKFAEVSKILSEEYGFSVRQESFLFRELDSGDLNEIAVDKAQQAFRKFGQPLIVEDTGVFFKAYKNFPGPLGKRVFFGIGHEGLLRLLEGKNRQAFFQTSMCYIDSRTIKCFEGKLDGTITKKVFSPRKKEMPYDMVFVPKGKEKPITKMTVEEKNALSHRGKVTRVLGQWLQDKEKQDFIETL